MVSIEIRGEGMSSSGGFFIVNGSGVVTPIYTGTGLWRQLRMFWYVLINLNIRYSTLPYWYVLYHE